MDNTPEYPGGSSALHPRKGEGRGVFQHTYSDPPDGVYARPSLRGVYNELVHLRQAIMVSRLEFSSTARGTIRHRSGLITTALI